MRRWRSINIMPRQARCRLINIKECPAATAQWRWRVSAPARTTPGARPMAARCGFPHCLYQKKLICVGLHILKICSMLITLHHKFLI